MGVVWPGQAQGALRLKRRHAFVYREPPCAQCDSIRLKLLKIGAQIKVTVRKVRISLAESYPYRQILERVYVNLVRLAPIPLRC